MMRKRESVSMEYQCSSASPQYPTHPTHYFLVVTTSVSLCIVQHSCVATVAVFILYMRICCSIYCINMSLDMSKSSILCATRSPYYSVVCVV